MVGSLILPIIRYALSPYVGFVGLHVKRANGCSSIIRDRSGRGRTSSAPARLESAHKRCTSLMLLWSARHQGRSKSVEARDWLLQLVYGRRWSLLFSLLGHKRIAQADPLACMKHELTEYTLEPNATACSVNPCCN